MMSEKEKAVFNMIWIATKQGAFQRARLYKTGADADEKEKFKKKLREFFFELFVKWQGKRVTKNDLYSIIKELRLNTQNKELFASGKMKFGNAQKFVNLFLKYMWLCDKLEEPPHFPVDRLIQSKGIKNNDIISWTQMKDKGAYEKVISRAEKVKGNKSLAQWELETYNKIIEEQG